MITRPLDLAAKLRVEPRNFDALFYVNLGVVVLFFAVVGSRYVLAPGLGVEFQLPRMAGARAGAAPTTHVVSVLQSGQIFAGDGVLTMTELRAWLKAQAGTDRHPAVLVRASAGVPAATLIAIASAAQEFGFGITIAADEPPAGQRGEALK